MSDFSSFKPSEESYGLLFWQTFSLWNRKVKDALKPYKLSHTQFVILNVIAYLKEKQTYVSQKDVSYLSKVDVMTVSTCLKTLIKNGYVVSEVNKHDPRANTLSLTSEGYTVQKKVIKVVEDIDRSFFEIKGLDTQQFMNALHNIKDHNSDHES
ncbi:MAG: MarR family winged helix-turn-helix transcriptional regulator [Erysipelothrix sp.]